MSRRAPKAADLRHDPRVASRPAPLRDGDRVGRWIGGGPGSGRRVGAGVVGGAGPLRFRVEWEASEHRAAYAETYTLDAIGRIVFPEAAS